jgi:hypothetical protein
VLPSDCHKLNFSGPLQLQPSVTLSSCGSISLRLHPPGTPLSHDSSPGSPASSVPHDSCLLRLQSPVSLVPCDRSSGSPDHCGSWPLHHRADVSQGSRRLQFQASTVAVPGDCSSRRFCFRVVAVLGSSVSRRWQFQAETITVGCRLRLTAGSLSDSG